MIQKPQRPIILQRGFSLMEVLAVITIIGTLALIIIPIFGGLHHIRAAKSKRNAQETEQVSASLSSLNIAHVLPESLGGVEATTRLLKHGIHIPDGPMEGTYFGIPNLTDKEIVPTTRFLNIVFDSSGLHLEYTPDPDEAHDP